MARLFYHKPRLAFLDEATSALDPENEDNIYSKLCGYHNNIIDIITIKVAII